MFQKEKIKNGSEKDKSEQRETSKEAIAIIQMKDSRCGWKQKEEESVEKRPEVEEKRLKFCF